MSDDEERRWGRWGLWCVAVTLALIAVLYGASRLLSLSADEAVWITLTAEVVLAVATFTAVGRAAGSASGFARTVGLDRPRWRDLRGWLGGLWSQCWALVGVGIIIAAADPNAISKSSNVRGVHGASVSDIVVVAIAAVLIAPIVEESQFRALLLRPAVHRYGFRPGAWGTSLLFGLMHGWEVRSVAGAVALVARMTVFGFVQCRVVRRNGRLLPNVLVHASFNLLAIVVAAAT